MIFPCNLSVNQFLSLAVLTCVFGMFEVAMKWRSLYCHVGQKSDASKVSHVKHLSDSEVLLLNWSFDFVTHRVVYPIMHGVC